MEFGQFLSILYWLVVSLCVVLIGGIAGGLVGAAFLGGTSDDLWDVGENYDTAEDNSGYYIWDKAGILAEEDHIALILQISDVVEARNCGVYIITISNTSNSGYSDTLNAAEEMYSELNLGVGANHNGVLLLMSTEDRHFSVVAYGDYVESIFNNKGLESLQNIFVPYFRNDDWYGGLSAYVSAVSELLDGVGLSAGTPVTIYDFVGDYTYDASFTNPDGTEANFCYMLSIEPSNNGVTISEMWRGMYTFCDDWASQNDLEGDTLYFVVKYGDNAGTHSLTYVPAAQSPYGADTIYIDGNTDMPFTRDPYPVDNLGDCMVTAGAFDNFVGFWEDEYDFGSGDTVYDYVLDSSSGYDFNHEPENWEDLINGFNALNNNLINNFWEIVDATN